MGKGGKVEKARGSLHLAVCNPIPFFLIKGELILTNI